MEIEFQDFFKPEDLEKLPLKYRFVKSRGKIGKKFKGYKKYSSFYNDDITPEGHYKPISKFIDYSDDK